MSLAAISTWNRLNKWLPQWNNAAGGKQSLHMSGEWLKVLNGRSPALWCSGLGMQVRINENNPHRLVLKNMGAITLA